MERNPFIIAGKIPTEFFCDRKEESERLIGCINNQENVVLISPRRVGKTGLIDFCFDKPVIKNQYITVTVDILHTTSFREFILSFGNAVYKKVAKRSERLLKLFASTLKSLSGSFGYDPIQNTPTFDIKLGDITSPEYTLEEIFDFLENAEQRCIVAIDEFQQIVYYPEKNIEAILRSYVQKAANANFIFAGSERRIMGEMFQSSKRPFFQSATLIPLEPIKLDLYTDFVLSHFKAVGKGVLPETVKKVYDGFNGVTLYIQRIFHDAYSEVPEKGMCSDEFAEALTNRYVTENSTRLREHLTYVSEQQKELLYAICSEGVAEMITSSAFVKRHRLKSASAVQSALKKLLEYDLVTEHEHKYSIADPLMRMWLKAELT